LISRTLAENEELRQQRRFTIMHCEVHKFAQHASRDDAVRFSKKR